MSDLAVKMVLSAEDKASKQIKDVADQVNKLGQQTMSSGKDMSASFDGVTKAIDLAQKAIAGFITYKLSEVVKDVALIAARYETLGVVMAQVGKTAGYTTSQMDNFALGLQKTGISMNESRENLARLVQAHVDLSYSAKLARIAQDAAVIGNMNSSETFGNLVYGIQSANVHVLRTIGINVNFESSYKTLADQIGKTTTDLSDQEKTQARLNAVLQSGETIVGTYEAAMGTAGKQINSMKRYMDDLKTVAGDVFTPALTLVVSQFGDAIKEVTQAIKTNSDVSSTWGQNLKLTVISVEAEVTRLAMFLDKVGGTMSSVALIATSAASLIPGVSDKGAQVFANLNIDFEKRYAENEKQLESLGVLYEKALSDNSPAVKLAKAASKAAGDAEIENRKAAASLQAFHDAEKNLFEKTAASARLSVSTDAIVQQNRHVQELTASLQKQQEYQDLVTASGQDAADAWIKQSLAADKANSKLGLKDAEQAAKEYQKALDALADAQDRLTMSDTEYKLLKLDEWYKEEAAALHGITPMLEEVYKNKKNLILLDEAEYDLGKKNAAGMIKDIEDRASSSRAAFELEKKMSDERATMLRSMYKDNKDYSGAGGMEYYKAQADLVEELSRKHQAAGISEVQDAIWKRNQLQKILDQQTLDTGSFMDGVKLGYSDMVKAQNKWGAQGKKAFDEFKKAGTSAISDGLFSVIKGDISDFSKLWQNFADSLLKTFTNVIAEMIMTAATKEIAINFKTSWVDTGANVVNFISKVVGYAGSLFSSASSSASNDAGSTYANHNLAYGGWVGGGRYGGADSYANDTVHIMGSPGEYMVPKSQVNAIAAQGRNGDSLIAHINPAEAALLKAIGGSGTTNPRTGLPEFFGWSDVANIVTGGVYGGISGDYGSLSGAGLATYFSPWVLTAEKVKHSANIWDIIDAVFDPITGPGLDELTRKTCKAVNDVVPWVGQVVEVIAPAIGAIVGSYFPPLGTAGGAFGGTMMAGKWNQKTNEETMKKAAIASAIAYVASSASEFVTSSTAPSVTPEQAANNAYTNAVDAGLSDVEANAAYTGAYQSTLSANSIQGITSSLMGKATAYATKWVMGQAFGAAFPPEQGQVQFDFAGASDGGLLGDLSGSMDKLAPESFSIKAPMFANGGAYSAGVPFWAGEKGPELVFPGSSGGRVVNHDGSLAMTSGDPEIKRLLMELIAATRDGKVITIDGKAFGTYTRNQAETVVTSRIDRGMVNDSRRLYN